MAGLSLVTSALIQNWVYDLHMHATTPALIEDPVLKSFGAGIRALYGDNLERVVLYGSRARGDARQDSDYDVAVFLKTLVSRWQEGSTAPATPRASSATRSSPQR